MELSVPHNGKGLDQAGIEARPAHYPQVCNGHGYLVKGWVYTACLKENNRLWGINPFRCCCGEHGNTGPGKNDISIFDKTPCGEGHHFIVCIVCHCKNLLIFCQALQRIREPDLPLSEIG